MKSLLVVLALLTAAPARAALYYSNEANSSSDTMRVGGVIKVTDPASPYVPTITLNGVGGQATVGALTGSSGTFINAASEQLRVGSPSYYYALGRSAVDGSMYSYGSQNGYGFYRWGNVDYATTMSLSATGALGVRQGVTMSSGTISSSDGIVFGYNSYATPSYTADDISKIRFTAPSGNGYIRTLDIVAASASGASSNLRFFTGASGGNPLPAMIINGDGDIWFKSNTVYTSTYTAATGALALAGQLTVSSGPVLVQGSNAAVVVYAPFSGTGVTVRGSQNGNKVAFQVAPDADGDGVLSLNNLNETNTVQIHPNGDTFFNGGAVRLKTQTGTELHYCNGGTFAGNIGRGSGMICTGGTATALGVYVQ